MPEVANFNTTGVSVATVRLYYMVRTGKAKHQMNIVKKIAGWLMIDGCLNSGMYIHRYIHST